MNTEEKIVTFCIISAVGIPVLNYIQVVRRERQKRREIQSNLEKDLKALHVSYGRVMERIKNGTYDGRGFNAIVNDFQFEEIINRIED